MEAPGPPAELRAAPPPVLEVRQLTPEGLLLVVGCAWNAEHKQYMRFIMPACMLAPLRPCFSARRTVPARLLNCRRRCLCCIVVCRPMCMLAYCTSTASKPCSRG